MSDLTQRYRELDQADPLARFRSEFKLNTGEVYLDGNSLGALPHRVVEALTHCLEHEWGHQQIRSWNQSWIDLPRTTSARLAKIVGAAPENLICADSVSVNLFKLAAASIANEPNRATIVSVKDMFPTDLYIAQGLSKLLGKDRCKLRLVDVADLRDLDTDTNLVILSQVNFRTGEAYDVARITNQVQQSGAKILWDISHSAGVLPINAERNHIDYMVGCGYKFLNGGPGAPAFLYVRPDLQDSLVQPLSGWMGHKDPFAFNNEYEAAGGMERLLVGTPNILSLVALNAALEIYGQVPTIDLFKKAQDLTGYFIELIEDAEELRSVEVLKPDNRGAQVSLSHPEAFAITQALIASGIICDFREPDIARFGFAPLYNSFADVAQAVETLKHIVSRETYKEPQFKVASKVT